MFKKYLATIDAWICPAPLCGQEYLPHEQQRQHISRLLPAFWVLTFLTAYDIAPHSPSLPWFLTGLQIATFCLLGGVCVTLCHRRHARFAAGVFLVALSLYDVAIAAQVTVGPKDLALAPLLLFMLPIFSTGVLSNARYCLLNGAVLVIGHALLTTIVLGDFESALHHSLLNYQITIFGTGLLASGTGKFHQALRQANRSEEMGRINKELSASINEVASLNTRLQATLSESEVVRNELGTVFNTVAEGLAVYGADGRERFRNDAFTHILHLPAVVAGGTRRAGEAVTILTMAGAQLSAEEYPIARLQRGEAVVPCSYRIVTPQGEVRIVQMHAAALWDVNQQIVGALEVAHDLTEEYYTARNLGIMRAISHACAKAVDEVGVGTGALQALVAGLHIPNGGIAIPDPDRPGYARHLTKVHTPKFDGLHLDRVFAECPIAPDAPLKTLRVLATGQPIFHFSGSPPSPNANLNGPIVAICVPLRCNGEQVGALTLAWAQDELTIYEALDPTFILEVADEIAASLHRARLYEDARRLALIDPLTNVYNHRALQGMLLAALATGSLAAPVSLIMLDIDHFRKFNEAHGHEAGDQALRIVAHAIQSVIRPGDSIARFGGEEFTILLPATDAPLAHRIAEEIRQAIAQQRVCIGTECVTMLSLTASLGHATFPLHASAAASLLKAVDLALYAAKRAGRDCIIAYAPDLLHGYSHTSKPLSMVSTDAADISLPTGADLEMVQALITAIDLRDGYTAAHSDGVARHAVTIGMELGLSTEHIEALRLGGLIHDVGKIGVPDGVLRKPGKLDAEEWAQMQAHTTMGDDILRPVEKLRHLLPLVRWHHERLDGSGYPDGLQGEQISLLVRILSVADVFDAFTAERPYHPARTAQEGIDLLWSDAIKGKMDAAIVALFADVLLRQGAIATRPWDVDLPRAA